MQEYEFESKFNGKWNPMLKRILRLLSENSRMSITKMAKELGVSRKTVENRLGKAEKELNIKYTIEIDESKLNLDNPHLIKVKFTKKPNEEDILNILNKSHIPQLAVLVDGPFDLLIYANAENVNEYVYWDTTTRVLLGDYEASWETSDLAFRHLGFFPLRNELLKRMEIPEIWEKIILLLNENSRMSFSQMSNRLNMKQNTLAYNFRKLLESGYIKRFTLVIKNPPNVSMLTLFGKYVIGEGFEAASMKVRKEVTFLDDKLPLISRCLFSARLMGSWDFFFFGIYDNNELAYEHMVKVYRRAFKNHKVKTSQGFIKKVIIGDLPIRSLDAKKEFNMIRWVPGTRPAIEKPIAVS